MKRNIEEWRDFRAPYDLTEEEMNDFQAQVIIDAIYDIGCLYDRVAELKKELTEKNPKE